MTQEIQTKSSTEDQPLPTPTSETYIAWVPMREYQTDGAK